MDFEYNGNLLEEDRINLVANEIVNKYPQVSFENAKEAAMLEGKIDKYNSLSNVLTRLYNIMLVNSDNRELVSIVYKDYLETVRDNGVPDDENKDNYIDIINGIADYLTNYAKFPIID